MSEKGWIRAAKGHEVNVVELSYRTGDAFLMAAKGRSNDVLAVVDSSGRAYSLAPHTLPSARGQGEPLTRQTQSTGRRAIRRCRDRPRRTTRVAGIECRLWIRREARRSRCEKPRGQGDVERAEKWLRAVTGAAGAGRRATGRDDHEPGPDAGVSDCGSAGTRARQGKQTDQRAEWLRSIRAKRR